jgi:hypothetical protein
MVLWSSESVLIRWVSPSAFRKENDLSIRHWFYDMYDGYELSTFTFFGLEVNWQ